MTTKNGSCLSAAPHAGQWYVAAFGYLLKPRRTLVRRVADQEIVFWRTSAGGVQAASAVCPHWGGPLGEGSVNADGALTCPWHGWQFLDGRCRQRARLKLPRYLAYDDGILLWVRLPWDLDQLTAPPLQARPAATRPFWFDIAIDSDVYHVQENYLDFLHPAEYHTTVFNHCRHLGKEGEVNRVELGYKLPFGQIMVTRACVWAPSAFQVRNEVYEGLGVGMVIESHITPLAADKSLIHEIYHVPEALAPSWMWPMARFFMLRSARQIRVEDAYFSARRYQLRKQGFVDGRGLPVNGHVAPYLEEWSESSEATHIADKLTDLLGKKAPSHY